MIRYATLLVIALVCLCVDGCSLWNRSVSTGSQGNRDTVIRETVTRKGTDANNVVQTTDREEISKEQAQSTASTNYTSPAGASILQTLVTWATTGGIGGTGNLLTTVGGIAALFATHKVVKHHTSKKPGPNLQAQTATQPIAPKLPADA